MSERGKRVFRFLLDQERDADVIGRIEAQPSMTAYVRELVRRDVYDERLDFAALKASELQAENAKLRELCATVIDDWMSTVCPTFPFCECGGEYESCIDETCGNQCYRQMARELGVEVDE